MIGSLHKGNMLASKGKLLKELDSNFQMHMVDEYKTFLICNACHQECQPVRHFTLNKRQTDRQTLVSLSQGTLTSVQPLDA